ncbi:MAG: hypothetical protein ACR2GF_02785 [Acidimicrobiales bacterium]
MSEQSWRDWWAERPPEDREQLRAMQGQPIRATEFLEDDEGAPLGLRVTGGMFHLPNFLFDEEERR